MGSYKTHGYDAVMELAEKEIDNLLACRFATGDLALPMGGSFELEGGDGEVWIEMLFDTPWARLVHDAGPRSREPGIRMVAPFDETFAEARVPVPGLDTTFEEVFIDLRGEVHVTAPIRTRRQGNVTQVFVATEGDVLTVDVKFTPATRRALDRRGDDLADLYESAPGETDQQLLGQLQDLPETVRAQVGEALQSEEAGGLPSFDLEISIRGERVELEVIDGPSTSTRCLLVLVELTGDPESVDRSAFEDCQRPVGTTASLAISADHILADILCPRLADGFGISEDKFEYPCKLAGPADTRLKIKGKKRDVTVHRLEASVAGGQIVVEGKVSTTYKNADVTIEFTTRVDVTYENGDLSLAIADVQSSSDVDLPWYLDLASIVLPFVGTLGVVIAQDIIENKVSGAFAGEIRGREDLTDAERANALIDRRLGRMSIDTFSFDEDAMVFGGTLLPHQSCRAAASGRFPVPIGGRIDLDAGKRSWEAAYVDEGTVDLAWRSSAGAATIRPRNGAQLGIIGPGPWTGPGSVLWLEAQPDDWWTQDPIERGDLPRFNPLLSYHWWLRFAVFTSEGRYARCGARLRPNGRLELVYHTFDRPAPEVHLGCIREVLEEEKVGSGTESWGKVNCHAVPGGDGFGGAIGGTGSAGGFSGAMGGSGGFSGRIPEGGLEVEHRQASYELYERSFRIVCEVSTKLLAYPLDYNWYLDGNPISRTGHETVNGHEVYYDESLGRCTLDTTKGKALSTSLAVEVIDNRGLTFTAFHDFDIPATIKEGGRPPGTAREQEREIERCMAGAGEGDGGPRPEEIPDQGGRRGPRGRDGFGQPGQPRPDPGPRMSDRFRNRDRILELRQALGEGLGVSPEEL